MLRADGVGLLLGDLHAADELRAELTRAAGLALALAVLDLVGRDAARLAVRAVPVGVDREIALGHGAHPSGKLHSL